MHYERVKDVVIDGAELDRRHRLMRESMAKAGDEMVIVFSTPLSAINVHYAANYDLFGDAAAVVVSNVAHLLGLVRKFAPLPGATPLIVTTSWR